MYSSLKLNDVYQNLGTCGSLKPDNLLLDTPIQASLMYEASCHCTLKVADFGLSKEKQRSFVSGVRDLR